MASKKESPRTQVQYWSVPLLSSYQAIRGWDKVVRDKDFKPFWKSLQYYERGFLYYDHGMR